MMKGKVTLSIIILIMIIMNTQCGPVQLPPWDIPKMQCSTRTILGLTMHDMQPENQARNTYAWVQRNLAGTLCQHCICINNMIELLKEMLSNVDYLKKIVKHAITATEV